MKKRQRLGQHFLQSQNIAKSIVESAKITKSDTVLEIGTGRGILTPLLCAGAKSVISVEADSELYSDAQEEFSNLSNLELVHGDGFKSDVEFTVFVSNLPYSQSRKAIEWLAQKKFSRAVIMVQKEFAEKLFSESSHEMRAVSVIANHAFDMEQIIDVGKSNFNPPPKVDSVVLCLEHKNTLSKDLIKTVNHLFSYRRKTLGNILKKFGQTVQSTKRLEELSGGEIIKIAKQITQ
ncbi:16S rRNA (adenine(1518)-N(6)/adenine(1519)-N(6))-dimethyltransferase RsmA [Candidatus Nitrosotenuis sp. DW1]|uniref:16S rRNA (adenine(1518)-N(6)/adenine(1519)-N(6))- dimethyltransferase RsmA n=1 Tax=Candidatus Nitrosotenuis sp. DW1 TaxID=2259672 RepID=UPI0015C7E323|nr:16S rRNA (adenine(1518)-N(6)/adenine(1519)-N(6))-dimethyltransferase RsmA [Candidatus Nitrosotenuis sp. DW1]QLH09386.1 ribosomal RNA small subunit methyltransferase A [Candidatus Nitrosotenuis sp. DW1]